jgi:hypothetical protein
MKGYILGEKLATWRRWKSVNVAFDLKDLHQEKYKKTFMVGYGAIAKMVIYIRKMMHNNKKLWRM